MPNFAKFLLACDLIMQLHRTVPPLFFFFLEFRFVKLIII